MMTDLISLDQNVLAALDFFTKNKPLEINIEGFHLPFVVGSGNAFQTGKILFSKKAAIFADESNFKMLISAFDKAIKNGLIKQTVVISASGGKDSVWEIELAKQYGLKATLLTTKKDSEAAHIADQVLIYQSIAEPYTYNVSTYMGMILSITKEDPVVIKDYINSLKFPDNFADYKSYSFVVPDRFTNLCPMLDIKKSELFGPNLSMRAFSQGHARHAKFVIRSEDELVMTLGEKNNYFGLPEHRWDIELPENINYAAMMAITYYIVGKIQIAKPQYYKENIENYINDYGPKAYDKTEPFGLIVPGSKSTQ